MIEYNIVVQIPPLREWFAHVKVKSIEEGKPHIVEPEELEL
ncbi:MAG: hypothetical protein ACXQTS_03745 [Candidatus Methanospirareceae archaeon]